MDVRVQRMLRELHHVGLDASDVRSCNAPDTDFTSGPSASASASVMSATEVMCRRTTSTIHPSIDVPLACTTSQLGGAPDAVPQWCRPPVPAGYQLTRSTLAHPGAWHAVARTHAYQGRRTGPPTGEPLAREGLAGEAALLDLRLDESRFISAMKSMLISFGHAASHS